VKIMGCGGKKGYKAGGMTKQADIKKDKGIAEKAAKKAVKSHEKSMHGMKSGGKVKMRGTGCAKRGIYSRGPMA
jgi:hypothetical protein